MAENPNEQLQHHTITREEYDQGRPWCATPDDLAAAYKESREDPIEERRPCHFTLRLLDLATATALDRITELVAIDDSIQPIAIAIRPVLQNGETGRREPYEVPEDGVITEGNVEIGYFVAGIGTGEDELLNRSLVLREPRQQPAIEVVALPLE